MVAEGCKVEDPKRDDRDDAGINQHDNQLIYVDWMSDGSARVKKTREEVGAPVAVGTDLKGDSKGSTITYKDQSCKD